MFPSPLRRNENCTKSTTMYACMLLLRTFGDFKETRSGKINETLTIRNNKDPRKKKLYLNNGKL
jgi:hypothetical protein